MEYKSVLISCPISNREKYLSVYLSHLSKLNYPKDKISFYFIINNSTDSSLRILNNFKRNYRKLYKSIKIDVINSKEKFEDERTTNVRNKFTYSHLSMLRNRILDYAKSIKTDYLFSVDSDIIINPNSLNKLIYANKPIISSLIYNGYEINPESPWKFTNIMKLNSNNRIEHISNWYTKNAESLLESKIIPVDITGAVSLIHKDVFVNNEIKYAFHTQGEDIPFSLKAKENGFNSYCDLSVFSYHCMNEKLLEEFKDKFS